MTRRPSFDDLVAHAEADATTRHNVVVALTAARVRAGVTQERVAQRMGCPGRLVADVESGAVDVRLSTLQRYARAVGARILVDVEFGGPDHD